MDALHCGVKRFSQGDIVWLRDSTDFLKKGSVCIVKGYVDVNTNWYEPIILRPLSRSMIKDEHAETKCDGFIGGDTLCVLAQKSIKKELEEIDEMLISIEDSVKGHEGDTITKIRGLINELRSRTL